MHAQVAEIAPELVDRLPLLNDLLSTGFLRRSLQRLKPSAATRAVRRC